VHRRHQAQAEQQRVVQRHRRGAPRHDGEREPDGRQQQRRRQRQHAAIAAIHQRAGRDEHDDHRDDLHEPDQAERERGAGARVQLVADRNR
jgi:hypothetical protein